MQPQSPHLISQQQHRAGKCTPQLHPHRLLQLLDPGAPARRPAGTTAACCGWGVDAGSLLSRPSRTPPAGLCLSWRLWCQSILFRPCSCLELSGAGLRPRNAQIVLTYPSFSAFHPWSSVFLQSYPAVSSTLHIAVPKCCCNLTQQVVQRERSLMSCAWRTQAYRIF